MQSKEQAERDAEYLKEHGYYGTLPPTNVMYNLSNRLISFDYDARTMSTEYSVCDWMLNPAGTLHGGFMAMCADIVLGLLVSTLVGHYTPTVDISISYLRPVPLPGDIIITAHAGHVGRTVANVTGDVTSKQTGELLATCTAIYYTAADPGIGNREWAACSGGAE